MPALPSVVARTSDPAEIRIERRRGVSRLVASLWLPRPPEEVFPFFADARNLERITPPILRFEIETPGQIAMREGALIDYRLRVRGVPLRWRTRIAAWDPPFRFVDEQIRGPYRLWRHEHTFLGHDGGTLCEDFVDYRPRGGPLAPLVDALFVRRDLVRIFTFRQRELLAAFPAAGC